MLKAQFFTIVFMFPILSPTCYASDQCVSVLIEAAKDVTKIDKTSFSNRRLKNWYCSAELEKVNNNKNGGLSIGIPIGGVPASLGAQASNTAVSESRKEFCSDKSRELSDFETTAILKQIGNPDAIKAWGVCMQTRVNPDIVALNYNVVDKFIQVVLKYNPPGGGIAEPILDQIIVEGARCSGVGVGQKIPVQGLPFLCIKDDIKSRVSMLLGTSYGVRQAVLNPDREGVCNISSTYNSPVWKRQSQPRQSLRGDMADLHCTHDCGSAYERGINNHLSISVGENERLVPESVHPSSNCSPAPNHTVNGCSFTHIVDGPHYSDRYASVTIRTWSAPVILSFSAYVESRSFVPVAKNEGSIDVKQGKTFVVTSPKAAEHTSIKCKLSDGNEFDMKLSETVSNDFVRRVSVNDAGFSTNYTYELRAQ